MKTYNGETWQKRARCSNNGNLMQQGQWLSKRKLVCISIVLQDFQTIFIAIMTVEDVGASKQLAH